MENEKSYLRRVLDTLENGVAVATDDETQEHLEFAIECVLEHFQRINEGK